MQLLLVCAHSAQGDSQGTHTVPASTEPGLQLAHSVATDVQVRHCATQVTVSQLSPEMVCSRPEQSPQVWLFEYTNCPATQVVQYVVR